MQEQAILLAAKIDEEREPLTAATNLTIDDQVPYVSPIVHAGLAEGLSFLAQAAGTQQILGFCWPTTTAPRRESRSARLPHGSGPPSPSSPS